MITPATDAVPLIDAAAPVRWVGYLSLFPVVGALAFRMLARRALGATHAALVPALTGRARMAALFAAMVLCSTLALRLFVQVGSFLDPGEPFTWAAAQPIIFSTSWGHGWLWQAGAALAVIAMLLAAARWERGWAAVLVAVAVEVFVFPLTGHATEHPWGAGVGVALQGLHVAGGALWLGTLAVLLGTVYPETRGDPAREDVIRRLVERYSPLALTGAGTAVAAGLVLSLSYVASWHALFDSSYGRALLIKVALLGGVLVLGYHNWRRVRPALGAEPGAARLRRSASVELLIGTLLLAVTAVLVALPAPGLGME